MDGLFITMEGIDGSGKSLQSKMLYEYLIGKGHNVVLTREPGGTKISEKIRDIIIDNENINITPLTESLLYAAARAQIISETIRPALLNGQIVICDRFLDSSIAYQGFGRRLGVETVEIINSYATGGLTPDITFLLDMDPQKSLARKKKDTSPDRMESEDLEFYNNVCTGYRKLAAKYNKRIYVINAAQSPKNINSFIVGKIDEMLPN